jgi:hypothetical protein
MFPVVTFFHGGDFQSTSPPYFFSHPPSPLQSLPGSSIVYRLAPEQARRSKEALLVKLVAYSWEGVWGWPSDRGVRGYRLQPTDVPTAS